MGENLTPITRSERGLIFTDPGASSVGRAEHGLVSSCVAQKTAFPNIFFLRTKEERQQLNNVFRCDVDGPFAVSFAVPVWVMVSGFIFGGADPLMKIGNCSVFLMAIHSGSINSSVFMH